MQIIKAQSLTDLLDQFPTEWSCVQFIASLRWPSGDRIASSADITDAHGVQTTRD